jgi:hypothetical protein
MASPFAPRKVINSMFEDDDDENLDESSEPVPVMMMKSFDVDFDEIDDTTGSSTDAGPYHNMPLPPPPTPPITNERTIGRTSDLPSPPPVFVEQDNALYAKPTKRKENSK